jgi:hypothetical protein
MIVIFVSHTHKQKVIPSISLVASHPNPTLGLEVGPTSTYLSPTHEPTFVIPVIVILKNNVSVFQSSSIQVVYEVAHCHK